MINGDHAQPQCHCPVCHDRGWIDDRSSAIRYLRRCSCCEDRRQHVGASASTR
jgi:hypothetical protein